MVCIVISKRSFGKQVKEEILQQLRLKRCVHVQLLTLALPLVCFNKTTPVTLHLKENFGRRPLLVTRSIAKMP
ncbi:hypothetical protein Y032_0295g1663 [Ancylostoma ceylanicum]|uniref:Uncharacterized protein n=1 Tax=Ancylostoma ceylanicum TaxID=53326 RepID=A0A016S5V8_9BILA|nr:hypothetical protein Y032_0295g1663 [Ancylostoma ceylanicum]